MSHVPDLNPFTGLSGPFVKQLVPMLHHRTDTGSPRPCWGKERQNVSVYVPLINGIEVSHNPGIPASLGNPFSCVQVVGNGNTSLVLADQES